MDACRPNLKGEGKSQERVQLVGRLFDALCAKVGCPKSDIEAGRGRARVVDLARVLGSLGDTADETGWFLASEGAGAASSGFPAEGGSKTEVSLEEFLSAMREAYSLVGHRAFMAATRAELLAATRSNSCKILPVGSRLAVNAHEADDASFQDTASATSPSAQGNSESGTCLYMRRAMIRRPTVTCEEEPDVPGSQKLSPSEPPPQLSSSSSAGGSGFGLWVTPPPPTIATPESTVLEETSTQTPYGAPLTLSRAISYPIGSPCRRTRAKTMTNLARVSCGALSLSLLHASQEGQASAPPSPLHPQRAAQNTPRIIVQHRDSCLDDGCSRVRQGAPDSQQAQPGAGGETNAGTSHRAQLLRLGSAALSTSASTSPSPIPTPSSESSAANSDESDRWSCKSNTLRWQLPEETLIVFDWDDTLCPTSFIHEDARLNWNEQAHCFSDPSVLLNDSSILGTSQMPEDGDASITMERALHRHANVARDCLRAAATLGKVVIVTLAKDGWVELSSKNFLPGLHERIVELGVEIVYARNSLPRWKLRCAALDSLDVLQLMKQAAMSQCVKKFYSARPGQNWKNIISIGDSQVERDALTEICYCRYQLDKHNQEAPCRCKTLKLPEDPDLLQLTAELELILGWIRPIVLYDGDIDLNFIDTETAIPMLEKVLVRHQQPCSVKSENTLDRISLPCS